MDQQILREEGHRKFNGRHGLNTSGPNISAHSSATINEFRIADPMKGRDSVLGGKAASIAV
jgi:hypothetical protein